MAVIPVCTLKGIKLSLRISCEMNKESYILVRGKFIRKTFVRYKGTLGDTRSSIVVVGVMLEDAMPMLYGGLIKVPNAPAKERSYDGSWQVQGIVVEIIGDLNLELVTLWNVKIKREGKLLTKGRTIFARITGPGKVPLGRVVLEHGEQ